MTAAFHNFNLHRRMLDIGGNSGEFAVQICRRVPELTATIFDLPLVCEIGREQVGKTPESDRIRFISGDALVDEWPAGHDLVLVILPLLFRLGGGGIGSGRPVQDAVLTLTNRRC